MTLKEIFLTETISYNKRMNLAKFGMFLKGKRQDLHETREVFSGHVGISASYLNSLERGLKTPSPELISNIAEHLKMKSGDLFEILNDEPANVEKTKPKSRIPDLPPDPPLEPELQAIIDDPELEIYFSRSSYGGKLSNRQKRQIALNIKMMYEENEERERR